MSDDENGKPSQPFVLSSLKSEAASPSDFAEAAKAMSAAKDAITGATPAYDALMRAVTGGNPGETSVSALQRMQEQATRASDILRNLGGGDAAKRAMDAARGIIHESTLDRITTQLSDQNKAINALRMPETDTFISVPRMPEIPRIPPNPLIETNKRLGRIERQFGAMQKIAVEAAGIATSLQEYAAEFLQKFESAAEDTNKAAGRAVALSVIAIILTLLTAAIPMAYDVFWRSPSDAVAAETAISELHSEIEALRITQQQTAERIEAALQNNSSASDEILRDIRDVLKAASQAAAEPAPVNAR